MHYLISLLITVCLAISVSHASAQNTDKHLINMQEADIRAFINDVSMVTGETFIVDPRVQGNVTITSEQSLSAAEVFSVFQNVMRVHGYGVSRISGGAYRISLLHDSFQNAPLGDVDLGRNQQVVTAVINLTHTNAAEIAKLIKPAMHAQSVVTANPNGRVIIITDFSDNVAKAKAIISQVDKDNRVLEAVRLTNMSAREAETALRALLEAKPQYKIVAIPAINALLIEGEVMEVAKVRHILKTLDNEDVPDRGNISVIPLRFANGENLLALLETLLPAYIQDDQPEPRIAYEKDSNTLVISAPALTQDAFISVIEQLDIERPQVLVEAIIVEISDTAARELGVQFALLGRDGSDIPFMGTNFSRSAPNILTLTGALASDDIGLEQSDSTALQTAAINSLIGLDGSLFGGVGRTSDTLFSAIVRAIDTDDDSNILSTPFVTTLDNTEASFLVGQEIPITTGESLGTNNANPFRTFQREEVGIMLNVIPQISDGNTLHLNISQEVSSIAGAVTTLAQDFVTNKREIKTSVLVNDGEIIVLGGLIQDDEQLNVDSVPVLGNIPVIGHAFRSRARSRVRTNLMVFIRPTIIRSGEDYRPLTERRLEQIRVQDILQSGREQSRLDEVLSRE